jgi:hypothetical protein
LNFISAPPQFVVILVSMTSALTVLTAEPIELFNSYRDSCLKRFQPIDEFEISLVDRLVAAGWRIARVWAMERKALDREMAAETRENDPDATLFDAFKKLSSDFGPLSRYEARLDRQFYRAHNALRSIRPVPPASDFYPRPSASTGG